jgi:two-component system nitrate/nitrite response regulator NarL
MLIIASASTHRIASWRDGLRGTDEIVDVTELSRLKGCLGRHTPQVLLLDLEFPGLGNTAATIRKLRPSSPATKWVALGQPASDDLEISLFAAGVRGVCASDVDTKILRRVVAAVRQGEPWIRRVLVTRLLDQLNSRVSNEAIRFTEPAKAAELTRREQQIAAMVRNGESSQQIARQLEMTEPTVKALLTDMLRKLGMDERLKLALMLNIRTES